MRYPLGVKNICNNIKSYANRGMGLEFELNETNNYYLINDIAVIHKKPTPITIAKVDYKSRCEAVIKEAYFKTPSTTDYNGIYKGRYIDFEAKETTNIKYFPLANIHNHQIKHLKLIIKNGGIGFIIVRFSKIDKTFYLDGKELIDFVEKGDRKSIPIEFFERNGYLIVPKIKPLVDYLEILNNIYFKGD